IRIAFEAIAKRCRCGKCKVCVLHFDGVGNVGPTPLKRRVPPRVLNALAPPRTGVGSSNLGPSLAEAARIVAANPTVDQFNLVIFSDFELLDPNLDQILHDLNSFPGEVHLVCLGEQLPPSIAGLLDERITVTTLTPANAPGAVARALLRSMTEDRPGARVADEPEA
ncbi:MAG: hypothetical protein VB036_05225, partial [Propionicimonas sp.]|nr:hypothetical protein [Propionicimonas sp.]